MSDCLFCKIIRAEIPAHLIYEDPCAIAVLDAHPRAPGHSIILPKKHAETIIDLPDEDLRPTFLAVKTVAKKLKTMLHCDGLTIGINQGRVSGQMIDHLHIHVIPRWATDGGSSIHSVVSNPPKDPLAVIAKKINGGN